MSTFVLVHGAWHGGWCWHKIVAGLEAMGHRAIAPDMPGHGTDRTPIARVEFATITERIAAVAVAADEPVILVGHSYGGAVITQLGEMMPEKIRKLVYVTALLLPNGQSASDAAADDTESALGPEIVPAADGLTVMVRPDALRSAFYAHCTDEDVALARSLLVPEALAGFRTPVTTSDARFGRIPRAYIECLKDRAITPAKQKALYQAVPCQEVFSLDTDHSPFFSTPEALTRILAGL
jgi:pimeloyl-ACP methyl ester carboxylesterase